MAPSHIESNRSSFTGQVPRCPRSPVDTEIANKGANGILVCFLLWLFDLQGYRSGVVHISARRIDRYCVVLALHRLLKGCSAATGHHDSC